MRPWAMTLVLLMAVLSPGCGDRATQSARTVDGVAYGVTELPFRDRWWQYYERALSWERGGFLKEAEADLRACLDQRQTDARRARTYGMHFVQCFPHRELGAVLLATGRVDESERELRLSIEQEPSAKADFLLMRLQNLRDHAARPPAPAAVAVLGTAPVVGMPIVMPIAMAHPAGQPDAVRPGVATGASAGGIDIASVQLTAGHQDQMAVHGRLHTLDAMALWSVVGQMPAQRIETAADGSFAVTLPVQASLRAGPDPARPQLLLADLDPTTHPLLTIDGPDHDQVVYGQRAWYRFDARSSDGLSELVIEEGSATALRLPLTGVRSSGMVAVDAHVGRCELRFIVRRQHGEPLVVVRDVIVQPAAHQDRALRATALAIPVQHPWPEAGKPIDDPELVSALSADGRFRLIDQRADQLLTQELHLVEAGYVDRSTAASAGRRLAVRYVISGTLVRGRQDLECYLRLIRSDTGQLICTADAYADHVEGDQGEQRFFAAVAGRLRQLFPVIEAHVHLADGIIMLDVGARSGVLTAMRFHVLTESPTGDTGSGVVLESVDTDDEHTQAVLVTGAVCPPAARVISE